VSKRGLVNAVSFFLFWSLFMYAIADHPVPDGFFWAIVGLAAGAAIVYWRIPTYLAWHRVRRRGRRWLALLDGVIVGAVLLALSLLRGSQNESEVPVYWYDYVILLVLLVGFCVFNSLMLYGANALVERSRARRAQRGLAVDAGGRGE